MRKIQNHKAAAAYLSDLAIAFARPDLAIYAGSVGASVAKSARWVAPTVIG